MQSYSNAAVVIHIFQKYPYNPVTISESIDKGYCLGVVGEGSDSQSGALQKILIQNDFYEKPQSKKAKEQVLIFLRNIVDEWSLNIVKTQKKISKQEMNNYRAKLLLFGSYVLGLNSNDSDIDVVCVVPNFINREKHFFQDLAAKLESNSNVKNLQKIQLSRVPIISFYFKSLPIDISFSQLNMEIVPRDIDNNIPTQLINSLLDDKCKTSLLGRKNNLMILQSTPNQEVFRSVLRLIKIWAKNRGISSNQMGYLGGISWAILVAKVCQIYPYHKPNKIFAEFFRIYSLWDWKNCAVKLIDMEYDKKDSPMTILTPGSPYNSTERINQITFKVLMKQIRRADELIQKFEIRKVFDKVDFFNEYPIFIQIDICGQNTQKEHQKEYNQFLGSVESKIVGLISRICQFNKVDIQNERLKIFPYPKFYKKTDEKYGFDYCYFFGVSAEKGSKFDIFKAVQGWCIQLNKIKKQRKNLNVKIFETKKQELTDIELDDFKRKRDERQRDDPRLLNKMVKRTDNESFKKQFLR